MLLVLVSAGGGIEVVESAGGGVEVVESAGATAAAALGAVPFCWMAIWVNFSWDLSAVGLMLKVMPLPQWEVGVFCLQ